jgi:hypothetical protein
VEGELLDKTEVREKLKEYKPQEIDIKYQNETGLTEDFLNSAFY